MSERPSPNVLVQIWLDSRPSWSTKNTNARRSCPGAVVTASTTSPATTKTASVAYSSMAMSMGLRCAVLMCWALYFSASAIAVNGAVRFRLVFASSGNSPLTTKCTATSSTPYPTAGTTQVRSARPGLARRRASGIRRGAPEGAAGDRDQPGDRDRGGGEQDGFPGDRAVGEQRGGQHVHATGAAPVGEQAAQHAGLRQRLGGVPAHADDQAEVGGEGEPPQGVPAGLAGGSGARRRPPRPPPHTGGAERTARG